MWRFADRFGEQQTLARRRREDPSTTTFFDQKLVIVFRVESKQRKLETILAAGLTVTSAAVAVQFREDRRDLIREIDRNIIGQSCHFNGQFSGHSRANRLHDGFAIFERSHVSNRVDLNDANRFNNVLNFPGLITQLTTGVDPGRDQLLPSIPASQQDPLGIDVRFQTQLCQLSWVAKSLRGGGVRIACPEQDGIKSQRTCEPSATNS